MSEFTEQHDTSTSLSVRLRLRLLRLRLLRLRSATEASGNLITNNQLLITKP